MQTTAFRQPHATAICQQSEFAASERKRKERKGKNQYLASLEDVLWWQDGQRGGWKFAPKACVKRMKVAVAAVNAIGRSIGWHDVDNVDVVLAGRAACARQTLFKCQDGGLFRR